MSSIIVQLFTRTFINIKTPPVCVPACMYLLLSNEIKSENIYKVVVMKFIIHDTTTFCAMTSRLYYGVDSHIGPT
jgi:hypothetical protein